MFKKFSNIVLVSFVLTLLLSISAQADEVAFSQVQVTVNQQSYPLEYAVSHEQRAMGLMHREYMCDTCGMLFNFQQARGVGMWMKNTLIPLSVAFIGKDGVIVNIEAMQPHDLTTTSSAGNVLYAWEMNQGWFAKNGIAVGDKVQIKE